MIRKLLLSLAGIFCLAGLSAQTTSILRGRILDQEGQPMPYVNVGVPGCSGTVSDLNGDFQLSVSECKGSDTLRISMIGYKPVIYLLQSIPQPFNVRLEQSRYELNEVKVRAGKLKEKERGNFTQSDNMIAGFKSNDLGSELVIKISVKDDAWIKKFKFYIAQSIFDTLFFRLNVYKMQNGKPGESLLNHPIYVTTTSKKGWNSVNLEKYDIVADSDFAIGLEWIRDLKKGDVSKGLMFSVGFLNKNCFYRKASQQEWNNTGYFGVGFNVVVAE